MTAKYWKTGTFISLQKEWYEKLEEKGFRDLESPKRLPDLDIRNASVRDYQAVKTYFSLAARFLNANCFESELHKLIWEKHAMGETVRKIGKHFGISKSEINRIVIVYKKQAGICGKVIGTAPSWCERQNKRTD